MPEVTTRLDDDDVLLTDETANLLLETAVANVQRDYPIHWTHLVTSPADFEPQRVKHPVFAGSYDWHSCVHQTWLIVRLLRRFPDLDGAEKALTVLDRLITEDGCVTEADFFDEDEGRYWERPYGWAWLLLLVAELRTWPAGEELARRLKPLATVLRGRMLEWLRRGGLPTRVGTHANSALACALVLDAARATDDAELAEAIADIAVDWYARTRTTAGSNRTPPTSCPPRWLRPT